MQLGADSVHLAAAETAAVALAAGGIPEAPLDFDQHVVGPFGAGFAWSEPVAAVQDVLPVILGSHTASIDCDSEVEEFTKVGFKQVLYAFDTRIGLLDIRLLWCNWRWFLFFLLACCACLEAVCFNAGTGAMWNGQSQSNQRNLFSALLCTLA